MTGVVACLTVTKQRLDLLPRAVTCFQRQSYPDRELIVVNDADDGTKEYLASLRDEKIVYVRPEQVDLRLGALRNVALAHARGRYVAQWDDDDWHHPDRLAAQVTVLEQARQTSARSSVGRWRGRTGICSSIPNAVRGRARSWHAGRSCPPTQR
jgi:glycosyltransferase involved in cell wall biosynthesis